MFVNTNFKIFALILKFYYNIGGDWMYSIENNIDNTIIIKKSKFITKLYKINSLDEVNEIINDLKVEYKDATHICYAYKLDSIEKCVDDGEPSGTAGLPILNVIKKNNLNYILCVVIRYFGGIKLGAGGLVRAYSNCITDTLKKAMVVELIDGLNITIKFNYENIKIIDNLLINSNILNKSYDEFIIYNLNINNNEFNHIKEILNDKCIVTINKNIYMTK